MPDKVIEMGKSKIVDARPFGLRYDLDDELRGCESVIVFRHTQYGRVPVCIRLVHQLYVHDVKSWSDNGQYEMSVLGVAHNATYHRIGNGRRCGD